MSGGSGMGGKGVPKGSPGGASSRIGGVGGVEPLCGWSIGMKSGVAPNTVDDAQTPLVYKSRKVDDEWFIHTQITKGSYGESVLREVRYLFLTQMCCLGRKLSPRNPLHILFHCRGRVDC